ncbi:MAG: CehA/McbA family metallohydrolase [Fibrobacterota bacterium]
MPSFRYRELGNWYKGNTHIHSTASDGGKTFAELARMYADQGFHFLFRTDHWVASAVAQDKEKYPLVFFDGVELHGRDDHESEYHVVCLGTFQGLREEMGLTQALKSVRRQSGLLILAHPLWMGNTFEEAKRHKFDGVEVYNHVCQWLNGKSNSEPYFHAMLRKNSATLAIASDDAHIVPAHPGWNGAWVMVNARALTQDAVLAALRSGNFYSTTGPAIHFFSVRDNLVTLECSPVKFAWLTGPTHRGQRLGGEGTLTHASFCVPRDWEYACIVLEDEQGRRAWTNTLFIGD